MPISMTDLWAAASSPLQLLSIFLICGVVFVNGWTDAPNAIASCVACGTLSMRRAALLAACFNLLGILITSFLCPGVAESVFSLADFGHEPRLISAALCASFLTIILWSLGAWIFGIPTSESHALLAGITGASWAIHRSLDGIDRTIWKQVICGLIFSCVAAAVLGDLFRWILRKRVTRPSAAFCRRAQLVGAAVLSFVHGAQDGQKFIGVFYIAFLAQTHTSVFSAPIWLVFLIALMMSLGTLLGGRRIIQTIAVNMVHPDMHTALCADIASALSLFVLTISGIPAATTQIRTTALLGASQNAPAPTCAAGRSVDGKIAGRVFLVWILTFPACMLLSAGLTRIFLCI